MYLDATNFSDGTLRFIALATLLLQPGSPKTIIIDEPELGLHPAAIIKLGALIKRASLKTQIIIATQSVELINNFNINDLIIVEGQTEEAFVKELMAPHFMRNGIYDVRPVLIRTSRGHKGALEIGLPVILEKCPRFRTWTDLLIHRCLK